MDMVQWCTPGSKMVSVELASQNGPYKTKVHLMTGINMGAKRENYELEFVNGVAIGCW